MSLEISSALSIEDTQRLNDLERRIELGLQTFIDVGEALLVIRDERLYREAYSTFDDYCRERWGMSRFYAHRVIEAAKTVALLLPIGNIPATESQVRPLTRLEPEQQLDAWREAVAAAPHCKVTAAHVENIVQRRIEPEYIPPQKPINVPEPGSRAHVSNNSGEIEWYTPSEYVEPARKLFGGTIDLDPCSCKQANKVVQARAFYTVEDDGLSRPWFGNVWMNPPYETRLVVPFISHLSEQYKTGNVTQSVTLVNNATETRWFQLLIELASAVAFVKGRISYWHPERLRSAPLQGQVFVYHGRDPHVFCTAYSHLAWSTCFCHRS